MVNVALPGFLKGSDRKGHGLENAQNSLQADKGSLTRQTRMRILAAASGTSYLQLPSTGYMYVDEVQSSIIFFHVGHSH